MTWPRIGDEVELFCPVPCDEEGGHVEPLTKGIVDAIFGEVVFIVRFPRGWITVVTRSEFTPH
jgi:hypothetical protein